MRNKSFAAGFLMASLSVAFSAEAQQAPLPTQSEIQADYDAQKYADVLKKIVRVLAVKGEPAAAFDRPVVLKLKAESQLRMNLTAAAADTYIALAKESKDENDQATAQASALLIRKSKLGKYTPRTGDAKNKTPIDILETESRKTAFGALFTDESPAVMARVEAAKKAGTLPKIVEATKPIADLRRIELASTGGDATTGKMLSDLSGTANKLMTEAVQSMSAEVKDISTRANKVEQNERIRDNGTRYTQNKRKGINSNDKTVLNNVISTCQQIVGVTDELASSLKAQASEFATVKTSAQTLSGEAGTVLNDDYDTIDREEAPRKGRYNN